MPWILMKAEKSISLVDFTCSRRQPDNIVKNIVLMVVTNQDRNLQ